MGVRDRIGIYPTLACADYLNLSRDISILDGFGVASYHIDIMDGNFVPNYCLNFDYLKAVKSVTDTECDVHLMTMQVERDIETSIASGADSISFHVEREDLDISKLILMIKRAGRKAGLVLNPETPVERLSSYLPELDYVVLMSVRPGFSGQRFIEGSYEKLKRLDDMRNEDALGFRILVDGGIDFFNAGKCIAMGADDLVAGALCIFQQSSSLETSMKKFISVIEDSMSIR